MIWKQELGIRNSEVDLGLRTMAKAYRSTFPTGLGDTKEKGADGLQSPSVNGLFLSKKDKQTNETKQNKKTTPMGVWGQFQN